MLSIRSRCLDSGGEATRKDALPTPSGRGNSSAPGADADRLLFWLGKGRINATKQSILARSCNWLTPQGAPDTRRVQKAAEVLRAKGTIVASSCTAPHGSYIAVTSEEIGAYKAQLFARVRAIVATARQIDKGWESELAGELFHPCRTCGSIIGRDLNYCDLKCRNAWHSRARVSGYASMGG